MKHQEFYNKYKSRHTSKVSQAFSRSNLWHIVLIVGVSVLLAPVALYKSMHVGFSLGYYLQGIKYSLAIAVPFGTFIFWVNWRELVKRSKGYDWVGRFTVTNKRSSFGFCYLKLTPGDKNTLLVHRKFFQKIRVGDFILIRRDALGHVEEIRKLNNLSSRLARNREVGKRATPDQST